MNTIERIIKDIEEDIRELKKEGGKEKSIKYAQDLIAEIKQSLRGEL